MHMPKLPAEKICLIRLSALGDVINALPLVNGLRREYPQAQLTWILQRLPHEAIQHQPNIDKFIIYDRKGAVRSLRDLWQLLRNERFDLLIAPQVGIKASLIASLLKADIKLGFDFARSREMHWLFTNRHIAPRPPGHVLDQYLEFLEYLEIKPEPVEWNIRFTSEELAWQKEFFTRFDKPVIAFVAASSIPEKDWRPDAYAEVINYIDNQKQFQPMIVGGPSAKEKAISEAILRSCKSAPVIALEKPIRHTLLQIAGAALVVSPDTGPLHAAVALGVPVVGLYGFSNPKRCGPYLYRDLVIDKFGENASGCEIITRKTYPGRMDKILPSDVIAKIEYAKERYGLQN
jgi:heptosyltransferase I